MEQWCNMQLGMARKLPPIQRLPPRYGMVTSNTSECINSMIGEYRSEGWTDLLEGTLHKITGRISEKRQLHKMEQGGDMVAKVKLVLNNRFQSAAAMEVMEVEVSKKFMVTERWGATLNINLNVQQTPPAIEHKHQNRNMPLPPLQARVKSSVLATEEKTCFLCEVAGIQVFLAGMLCHTSGAGACAGLLQEQKYQQIYAYDIFPIIQDQIRYNGKTNPLTIGYTTTWSSKKEKNLKTKPFHWS